VRLRGYGALLPLERRYTAIHQPRRLRLKELFQTPRCPAGRGRSAADTASVLKRFKEPLNTSSNAGELRLPSALDSDATWRRDCRTRGLSRQNRRLSWSQY
jgi:hypothetical protein